MILLKLMLLVPTVTLANSDHNSWMNAPAGFLRDDMTPKPVYTRLLNLIHKTWWTNDTIRTNPQGRVKDRVFYGAYTITVTDAHGRTTRRQIFFPQDSSAMTATLTGRS